MSEKVIYQSLFEDDYLRRSLGTIVTQPDIALTELVANAWDAGATEVNIFIPDKIGDTLTIEDNGTGLTSQEFQDRWMCLRYDRIKHQGRIIHVQGKEDNVRYTFGHNGVGRHGLLCFGPEYKVITSKNGKELSLTVTTKEKDHPIAVIDKTESLSQKQGTKLEVVVDQNLPKVEKIRDIISARFLHDPQFRIQINKVSLDLSELKGIIDTQTVNVSGDDDTEIELKITFVDTQKASRKSIYQGVAFWQGKRLVGEPSWNVGKEMILDGRTTLAKRYTVIVETNDLADYIKEDWTGFKQSTLMDSVYEKVCEYINAKLATILQDTVEETKEAIKKDLKAKLQDATPLMRYEIDEIITNMAISSPKVKQESISLAVEAVMNLEKSKSGQELLKKISTLNEEDIEGLNQILSKWTVKDALVVLNEIDRRLSIIEAIRKLSKDTNIDELHILHPMVTEARWLFGPEYDTAEYISNRQIQTVVAILFDGKIVKRDGINYKKRPDIVCLADSTISMTGLEEFSSESQLMTVTKILLIELKRGGFKLTRAERDQANAYVEDILASQIGNQVEINAYVVGDSIANYLQSKTAFGSSNIFVTTYDQLVDTAEKRLFGLRTKLSNMYDDVPGMDLYKQTINTIPFK